MTVSTDGRRSPAKHDDHPNIGHLFSEIKGLFFFLINRMISFINEPSDCLRVLEI